MRFQDVVDDLRQQYKHVQFLFITSPTERCGITLIQRMLNAGKECIVYGENGFLLFHLTSYLVNYLSSGFSGKAVRTRQVFQDFRDGNREMDGSPLFPNFESYAIEVLRSFYRLLEFYQMESEKIGYKYWGIKCPLPSPDIDSGPLFRLLPTRHLIILERGLEQVAKSAYARWPEFFTNAEGFRTLGYRWMKNRIGLQRVTGERVLRFRYEEWMRSPDAIANKIEQTFGVHVDRAQVLEKINMEEGAAARFHGAVPRRGGYYLPPARLPEGAAAWLREGADAAMAAANRGPQPTGSAS